MFLIVLIVVFLWLSFVLFVLICFCPGLSDGVWQIANL
ncbi:hypothetical protein SX4_1353 [Vibrio mimicus SX-4]|nr:hypothetical protein SX4_1353 [Vibrio mimicus SX-4]